MGVLALFLQAINSQKEKLKIKSAKIKFLLRFFNSQNWTEIEGKFPDFYTWFKYRMVFKIFYFQIYLVAKFG
jgi:hypothetical protein